MIFVRSRLLAVFASILVLILSATFSTAKYSLVDVTDLVQVNQSRIRFDRRTNTSYLDFTLTNTSNKALIGPVVLIIESISDDKVTVNNVEGTTEDGHSYITFISSDLVLLAGESSVTKRVTFNNSARARFSYTCKVFATEDDTAIAGNINLPENISPVQIRIQAPGSPSTPGGDGTFQIIDAPEKPFLVTGLINEQMVAISLFNSDQANNGLSCQNTAITLALIKSLFITIPPQPQQEIIEIAKSLPEIDALATTLCEALAERATALSQPDDELQEAIILATTVLISAVNDIALQAQQ